MVNNSIVTTKGKNIVLNRAWKATPDYTPATTYRVGINNDTPLITNTKLDYEIPISDGTVSDNGENTLTGSSGGDNSTNNTTIFKEGAGETDNTAQNLIANDTNATKTWTIADLAVAGSHVTAARPYAIWLYIKDSTTLTKFLSAGTCLQIRFRTNGDAANKYYGDSYTASQLSVGWNWITSNTVNVNDLSQGAGGAPSGVLDEFVINIITNNATDTFVAGDVVYDLLRQWGWADLVGNFVTGYPTFDYVNNQVSIRTFLSSLEANGFLINGLGLHNTDGTVLMHSGDTFTGESKSSTDEFAILIKDRIL
jgi:hypothetical protein